MWFKNLTFYRFVEPFTVTPETLAEQLAKAAFRPCGSHELKSTGWVPPLGRKALELVHSVSDCVLLCLQSEEKLLPASVVSEIVADKVAQIEVQQSHSLSRNQKGQLREEVLQTLLPRAFSRVQRQFAYIDRRDGWLVIDSASRKAIQELTAALRRTVGTLPIESSRLRDTPTAVMTAWLLGDGLPPDFVLQDECELRDGQDESGVIRCRGQDLTSDEVRGHLQAGKQVARLALEWDQRIACVLQEDLSIRRLRFLDAVGAALDDVEAETEEQRRDAEFALMSGELRHFWARLLDVFGGERRDE